MAAAADTFGLSEIKNPLTRYPVPCRSAFFFFFVPIPENIGGPFFFFRNMKNGTTKGGNKCSTFFSELNCTSSIFLFAF